MNVNNGATTLFWKDMWMDQILAETHPRAFSFALHEDISVADFWASNDLHETFHLPLSPTTLDEFRDMQLTLTKICPSTSTTDVWHYMWGAA